MFRVVVIGGGLSGLAAAALLEQQNIDYTLIEVKRRVGGSLISQSVQGFIFDGIRSICDADLPAHPLMATWGLQDALAVVEDGVIFRQGIQMLVDALSARISGPRLMRMALSSIGELEGGSMALCMENGLMLNARAIILALPARYAERVFYGYRSEITEHLLSYQYEPLTSIALGYPYQIDRHALPVPTGASFLRAFHHVERGGSIVQVGLALQRGVLTDATDLPFYGRWELPRWDAIFQHHWPEADPLTLYREDYPAWRDKLMAMIPPRVALIGSDYVSVPLPRGIAPISQCLSQAQEAVKKILNDL